MIVNSENVRKASAGLKTAFNEAFDEAEPKWPLVATEVKSESGQEVYGWIGKMPQMRKWIGERQIQNLSEHDYTIKNETYESTIGLNVDDVDDNALGFYKPTVANMAKSAKLFPDKHVFSLLKIGFVEKCYDGKPFFSTVHPNGKDKYSNMGTKKLSAEAYGIARSSMLSIVDPDSGDVLDLDPGTLVVSPQNEAVAKRIVESEKLENGENNPYYKTAKVLMVQTLATMPDAWFLLDTAQALKPLIYQNRKSAEFASMQSITDEHVFISNEVLHGVKARAGFGYGFWQMAYGSNGTTE